MSRDTVGKTFGVAGALCVLCSVLVSGAAVGLKSKQDANKRLDLQKNVLSAAGLYEDGMDVAKTFDDRIETRVIDLRTGEYTEIDPATFDQRKASKQPGESEGLSASDDPASIKRLEHHSLVYMLQDGDELQQVILPIRGMGLWGTLYGFLALGQDLKTVKGLTYYEHKETPGLGGEVDNPRWKAQWVGKEAFDDSNRPALEVKKGLVDSNLDKERLHKVDGLAGATITSKGVTNMMKFWLGEAGFGPYLSRLQAGGAQ